MNNCFNYQVLNEIKLIQSNFIVEVYLYKIKKPLKIIRLTTVIVSLTIPFSNSFYQNLTDIYALKELLYNEGLSDYNGLTLCYS
jgi:hypothetical protein